MYRCLFVFVLFARGSDFLGYGISSYLLRRRYVVRELASERETCKLLMLYRAL